MQAAVNESMQNTADLFIIAGRQIAPIPLGKRTVKVQRYDHKKKAHIEEDQTLDFFRYMIDLPPSGGMDVKLGNNQFVHGETYDLDLNTLRSVQEVIYRSWMHEAQINGNQEAQWGRKKLNTTMSMKSGRVTHG